MNNLMSQFEGLDTEFLLFTKDVCGYCVAAKNLLNSKGLTYTEVNLQQDHELRSALIIETGHKTVPIIFDLRSDVSFVGGYTELKNAL